MKKNVMIVWSCLLLLLPYTTAIAQHNEVSKIRAAYWWTKPPEKADEQLRMLKQHGLNTALLKDGSFRVRDERWLGWGHSAHKHGIALFPVLNFAGEEEVRDLQGQFRPYVNAQGQESEAPPCPLDSNYWELAIAARVEELARMETPLAGVLFDTEMYGAHVRIYDDACLCDVCWTTFVQQAPSFNMSELAKDARHAALVEHGKLDAYLAFQEASVQQIVSDIERRIHAIQPELTLGFLFYRDNWFYHGLVKGLGTARNPALVFSENSYSRGYTPQVSTEFATVHNLAPNSRHVRHIAGLWMGRFLPQDLAVQAYRLATATDGYWLFSADSLWRDHNEGAYTLNGSHAEHWAAFQQANSELDHFEMAPATYQTSLPALYPSSYYDAVQKRLSTPANLPAFLKNQVAENTQIAHDAAADKLIYRGTALLHVLNAAEAQAHVTHVPLGNYRQPSRFTLFDDQGRIVLEGQVDRDHVTTTIPLSQYQAEWLSLRVESGMNAMRIVVTEAPYLVEASTTFRLSTISSPFTYAFVAFDRRQRITIRAFATRQEPVRITVRNPEKQPVKRVDVTAFTVFTVPIHAKAAPQPERPFWMLDVAPVPDTYFEDVWFAFYNSEFPYLLVNPQ